MADISVKVAVRIRPLVRSEKEKGSQEIIESTNNQIVLKNTEKAFTYNYVLGPNSPQDELYDTCVKNMIKNLFNGYNVTILAYGQTGSGKTYSMGTAYSGKDDSSGVIPRAVADIFTYIADNFAVDFNISVSFIELYKEVLYDLLSPKGATREDRVVDIREDALKGIHMPGLTELPVSSASDVLNVLKMGSISRATASTNMNAQSSRSHAIFSISICMQNKNNSQENKTAKLHLVDLAGSERPSKTGAIGNTFKEGVKINHGLFVLGNVISALGDPVKLKGHIPYRDSNLTRLLKDSLGGNSITLMVACVSPADYNLEETLSTLRYADRARRIKNKPIVNQDPKQAEINDLKRTIQNLRMQIVGQGGTLICPAEIELLKKENSDLKLKVSDLTNKLSSTLRDNMGYLEKLMMLQNANEVASKKLFDLKEQFASTVHNISIDGCLEKNPIKEHLAKLLDLQAQFSGIAQENANTETEFRKYEENIAKQGNMTFSIEESQTPEVCEQQESHATKQMEINTEINEISNKLLIKQHLAQQIMDNMQHMIDYNGMAENEQKIVTLQKEKDELLLKLKSINHSKDPSNKLAEQRRKRVQELEAQMQELQRKVQEQARLIKLKEKDEQRIKQLNSEIVQIKQMKVKLIRTMREENDKFRLFRNQREQEVRRLKNEDRKKQNQIVQMTVLHNKQQVVFKRKVEEAAALNRRLKDALALRKQVQVTKNNGKVERLSPWIKQEFDLFAKTIEAEWALKGLLEDRTTLTQQLLEMEQDPANAATCNTLREDIEVRSLHIQQLQQKILDSNEGESKSRGRFDNMQSMAEAKFVLKEVFVHAGEIKKEQVEATMKMEELQSNIESLQNELKNKSIVFEQKLRLLEQSQEGALRAAEEKISVLLCQLRNLPSANSEGDLVKTIAIQHDEIASLTKANEDLQAKLRVIADSANNAQTPIIQKRIKKQKLDVPKDEKENIETFFEEIDEEQEEDLLRDPDWRKTPIGKRIMEQKRRLTTSTTSGLNVFERGTMFKRSSQGGCTCRGKCTNRCGCKKVGNSCGISCKCKDECDNRGNSSGASNHESDGNEGFETCENTSTENGDVGGTFKKPRLQGEDRLQKQRLFNSESIHNQLEF